MANAIVASDFLVEFEDDFYNDMPFIVDRINDTLAELDRNFGGQLEEMNRDFTPFRKDFLTLFEAIITAEVLDNRGSLDACITDAICAALAICAKKCRRGTREGDRWISDEMSNNPFLENIDQRSTRDRDRGGARSSSRGSSRYSRESRTTPRRTAADYQRSGARTEREDRDRDGGRRRTSRDEPRSRGSSRSSTRDEAPRGRIAALTKPEATVAPTTEAVVVNNPVPVATNDAIITSANLATTGVSYGLLYVAGDEEVFLDNGSLDIREFDGANGVDYEQHRIDRFYPDILGTHKTDLTAVALREAEKVKDQTIASFVADPTNPEAEAVSDPKLFQHAVSGSYDETLRFYASYYNPLTVRDTLIEAHNGNYEWFVKHSLFVKVEQVISLEVVSNDNIKRMTDMILNETMFDTVSQLVTLSEHIDPVIWRFFHDYITAGFNKRLVSLDLGITLDSITADWSEFCKWLAVNRPEYSETLNFKSGIMNGVAVLNDEETKEMVINRDTLFLPINSYDLDFAAATASLGYAVLNEKSKIFRAVNDLMNAETTVLYINTLDGQTIAVRDISGVMGVRYFITKE